MIDTVIIEDQANHRDTLQRLLAKHCPRVQVRAVAGSIDEAAAVLDTYHPELVFLDVELEDGDCFDLLDQAGAFTFRPIFTTAHDHYALRAIKYAALDYLLKPISTIELKSAVAKFFEQRSSAANGAQSKLPARAMLNGRLALPTAEGFYVIDICDILRLEARRNYTEFFIADGSQFLVSRSIGEYSAILGGDCFFRIHDAHLVNILHINKYISGKGGHVALSDGSNAPVSVRKREAFLNWLRNAR